MAQLILKKKSQMAGLQEELPLQRRGAAAGGLKGETVRLTLAVPRALHRQLRLAAADQERTIVSLVSGWIEEKTAAI